MLKSIFSLPQSKDELEAANSGFSSWKWLQKAPLRNIRDTDAVQNFNKGQITFRWDMSSSTYFMPSKCFVRMRCSLTKNDGSQLETVDQIAPSMGLMPQLINECNVTINDQQISVADRHIGEIESMYTRLNHSGSWLKSTGNATNFWESSLRKRVKDVAVDAVADDTLNALELRNIESYYSLVGAAPIQWRNLVNYNAADDIQLDADNGNAARKESSIFYTDAAVANRVKFIDNDGNLDPALSAVGIKVGAIIQFTNLAGNTKRYAVVKRIESATDASVNGNTENRIVFTLFGDNYANNPIADIPAQAAPANGLLNVQAYDIKNNARRLKEFEITWTPRCLSFFRLPHALPGGCKYQLNLTPKNLYREAAVESLVAKNVGVDYNFKVLDMFLYVPTFEGKPQIDTTEFYLDLNEIRCQKVDITAQETSYTLDVRPSTNALAVATQSSQVDNATNWSSSKFVAEDDFQEKINAFHIRYGAEQKPIPDFDISFTTEKDNWNEVYMRNLLASGGYFDSSSETLQEWFERGPYIYQIWNRSGDDRETRVYVKVSYSEAPPAQTPKLLLFNFYKKYAICKMENARWTEMLIQEG